MGEMIRFQRPDGKDCPAYEATSKSGASGPAIVVVQEWWGLNPQIKKTADRFAEAGYRAIVPDLFRGKLAKNADEASHLMGTLDFLDAAGQDVAGAVGYLKKSGAKVAVGGFCMGGALTILSALCVNGVDAGVCFYGMPPAAIADPSKITIPMIYHFAKHDDWVTPAVVDALEKAVANTKAPHDIFRYDAHHAFMNEARPEVYDAAAAKTAWERTLSFLQKSLSG